MGTPRPKVHISGHRGHSHPLLGTNIYQDTRCKTFQRAIKPLPSLPCPTETNFFPSESPISLTHRHLIILRSQRGVVIAFLTKYFISSPPIFGYSRSNSQVSFYWKNIVFGHSIGKKINIQRWSGSSSNLNFLIFGLYAVVSNFAVNFAHNFIGSFFW